MFTITSTANPKIKAAVKLQDARERRKTGLILIEGSREIALAVQRGLKFETLFFCPELFSEELPELAAELIEVSRPVFAKLAYKENPEGLLAIARPPELTLEQLSLPANPLVVILEQVEKPGNLGAILRTAYAAKVDAVIINQPQTDLYNPNVIRASMGHLFTVPTVIASTEETVAWLRRQQITSYATAITAQHDYSQEDYRQGSAIIMGTENSGLSSAWLSAADKQILIPMRPGIDSLNVSVSTALVVYEAWRQRQFR